MTRDERIAAAMAAIDGPCREAIEPVLRALIHDLNGALSAVTMEAFAIDRIATNLGATSDRMTDERRRQLEGLQASAGNLRQTADGAAAYLGRVEALTDELVAQK